MRSGVLLVVGQRGSGKSSLVRAFLRRVPRSIAIDTHGEYGGVRIGDPASLAAYVNARRGGPFRVSYRDKGEGGGLETGVALLRHVRDVWVVLEEASLFIGPSATAEGSARWFLNFGRHRGISVLVVTQRAHEVGPAARAQADVVVSFRQSEPRDLAWIAAVADADTAATVSALGEHEWCYVAVGHGEIEDVLESIATERPGA